MNKDQIISCLTVLESPWLWKCSCQLIKSDYVQKNVIKKNDGIWMDISKFYILVHWSRWTLSVNVLCDLGLPWGTLISWCCILLWFPCFQLKHQCFRLLEGESLSFQWISQSTVWFCSLRTTINENCHACQFFSICPFLRSLVTCFIGLSANNSQTIWGDSVTLNRRRINWT